MGSNLLAARELMAFTLGFHIVLACLGVALPAMILTANYLGLKRDDEDAMRLARRWSKAMAVTFAVGAVTGTVLSFEFGLLWPRFMDRSEEHTSELQSLRHLVCRLLLEKNTRQ